MPTFIEKDSPATALIVLGLIFLLFAGGVLGLAYLGGVFTGKNAVRENDARITKQNLSRALPLSAPTPATP